jgi:predicted nucleic acid-binding Zn ribbon protein
MSGGGPRRIGDLLQFGDIGRLKVEAEGRRELAGRVRAELPPHEAAHVVSARLDEDGRLVVGMDSAAWAARLRYSTAELLGKPIRVHVAVPGDTGD